MAEGELDLERARELLDARLDALDGPGAGRVESVLVDARGGEPTWLCVRRGRRRGRTAVPAELVAGGAGRAWTPLERGTIRSAPVLLHDRGLSVGEERRLTDHYGIPTTVGRPAALADRDFAEPGSVRPPGSSAGHAAA